MVQAIIPRIGYFPFMTSAIRRGMSFINFLDWLSAHPLIGQGSYVEMADYWASRERGRAFVPLIEALDPKDVIPADWSSRADPGRQRRFSYVVSAEARDAAGNRITDVHVIVQSDVEATKGEILQEAEGMFSGTGPSGLDNYGNVRIEYVEQR